MLEILPLDNGIIPAYAGSTAVAVVKAAWDGGSSPHTRGARPLVAGPLAPVRIIPAYAGSTTKTRTRMRPWRDHPRIRGEHWAAHEMTALMPGSSPHTRGALAASLAVESTDGIIPAYAGSTVCATHGRI